MFHILVVEDDKNTNKLMGAILRAEGYTVTAAFDGREALDRLDERQFDLIVADVMMPNLDGYQLTETLRAANYTAHFTLRLIGLYEKAFVNRG